VKNCRISEEIEIPIYELLEADNVLSLFWSRRSDCPLLFPRFLHFRDRCFHHSFLLRDINEGVFEETEGHLFAGLDVDSVFSWPIRTVCGPGFTSLNQTGVRPIEDPSRETSRSGGSLTTVRLPGSSTRPSRVRVGGINSSAAKVKVSPRTKAKTVKRLISLRYLLIEVLHEIEASPTENNSTSQHTHPGGPCAPQRTFG